LQPVERGFQIAEGGVELRIADLHPGVGEFHFLCRRNEPARRWQGR
jgi:hypothetical protein